VWRQLAHLLRHVRVQNSSRPIPAIPSPTLELIDRPGGSARFGLQRRRRGHLRSRLASLTGEQQAYRPRTLPLSASPFFDLLATRLPSRPAAGLSPSLLSFAQAMASFIGRSASSSEHTTPRSASPSSSIGSARSSHSSISNNKRLSITSSRRISAANPMSSVDLAAIEESLKMTRLDQLRGYAQNHFGEVHQYRTTEYTPQTQALGYQVLREPLWNKGQSSRSF
jgi:hypothetical protein